MFTLASIRRSDDAGATAIEYAIIAGLIGLGLVGSLVATRGSLSSIFGTASGQMGSATGAAPASAFSTAGTPQGDYWQSKGLVSAVKSTGGGSTQYNFTYADGSSFLYAFDQANPTYRWSSFSDTALSRRGSLGYDPSGNVHIYSITQHVAGTMSGYADGNSFAFTNVNWIANGVPYNFGYETYKNGIRVSSTESASPGPFMADFDNAVRTLSAFQAAAAKI